MKRCEDCEECVYICEGDYACMKEPPKIVITEFNIPTELYMWCEKE